MITLAKVLIVDDEPHIRRLLKTSLARSSYDILEAETAREALEKLTDERPDVVLLDLGLPDRDGLELVPIIKKQSTATLLVVSARDATDQKVAALDLGADDYVTKPFDSEELLARVRTALRHRMNVQGAQSSVVAADVEIDLVNRRVLKAGADVHLTPKEFGVIAELAKFPGRVITHQKLLSAVWPTDYERHIEYLRVVIRNIRQKIETDVSRPNIIINELGIGYRLKVSEF
ncbi:MAG: response regulator transcription factor [Sphingobium sp.]|nr:MAG: DNA-binding response regulator [Stutzerimonas stutzeri]